MFISATGSFQQVEGVRSVSKHATALLAPALIHPLSKIVVTFCYTLFNDTLRVNADIFGP
jgi:hypothetical protein